MPYPEHTDFHDDEPDFEAAIQNAAESRGIALDPDRLFQLTEAAGMINMITNYRGSDIPKVGYTDIDNDIWVDRAAHSDHYGTTAARLDFAPVVDRSTEQIVGATGAARENTTLFT